MTLKSNNNNHPNSASENVKRVGALLNREGYMSMQIIARGYKVDPKWAFERWLSEPTTLEYIQLWERLHNPDFNNDKYISVCDSALGCSSFPTLEDLKLDCSLKSIYVDLNFKEEVYLHRDIASDFACWLSPAFRVYCFQRLSQITDENPLKFASEEDFIVSKMTVAQSAKRHALKKYLSDIRMCNFYTNKRPEYRYSIKGKLNIENNKN